MVSVIDARMGGDEALLKGEDKAPFPPAVKDGDSPEGSRRDHDVDDEKLSEGSEIERGLWGSQLDFVMTCISYAVGIGNIWRFPYICYKNGGGAFLVPYIIMLCIAGIPIFFMEMAMGQFSSLGPTAVWKCCPLMKGIGYGMIVVCSYFTIYFAVLIAYVLFYLIFSFTTRLAFSHCENAWNTVHCTVREGTWLNVTKESSPISTMSTIGSSTTINSRILTTTLANGSSLTMTTPSEEFFYRNVLRMSGGIEDLGLPDWRLTLLLFACWAMTLVGLIKGVRSLGKISYFTAIFPYVIITALVVRGCTLDGAVDGLLFYITPRWEKLLEPSVWADAAIQIFYSLGICCGCLIAMSSYNRFENNFLRNAIAVASVNCGTSVFGGFAIFSVIGFMSKRAGLNVEDVLEAGPGLAFVVYPEGLSKMPLAPMWSVFFYLMMTTMGMGSNFSQLETVISALQDEWPILRQRGIWFRTVVCIVGFLAGLPLICPGGFYLFNILDNFAAGINLLLLGLMEVVTVMYIYGFDRFSEDVSMMLGRKLNLYWRVCLRVLSIFAVSAILVISCARYRPLKLGEYSYPGWAVTIGWLVSLSSLIWLPLLFMKNYCIRSGMWEEVLALSRPEDNWGPAVVENRTGRYMDDDEDDDQEDEEEEKDNISSGANKINRRSSEKVELPMRFLSDHHRPPRYAMSAIPTSTKISLPVFTQARGLKSYNREDSAVSSLNLPSSNMSSGLDK